jgi:medium-chain acyl-[acyl-carrier-protein] hydrolase
MSPHATRNPWIAFRRTTPRAKVRLFCLPYAGAGASVFRPWAELLPLEIELCAIQLPGREDRSRDARFTSMDPLVEALAAQLAGEFDRPFAIFGHSMGAIIAYELACVLRRKGLPDPVHLFVSGRRGPQVPYRHEPMHHLGEAEFVEKLRRLNGTPEEVLQHPELLAYIIPTLRADFAICETYAYRGELELECPLSAFGGLHDGEVSEEDLEAWSAVTAGPFRLDQFPGDHFFLHACRPRLLAALAADLTRTLNRA